ncbi:MAG: S8 family peptidase [Bacteroidota bacterium]
MKIRFTYLLFMCIGISLVTFTQAQSSMEPYRKGWHLEDFTEKGNYGISVEKAYAELLSGKKPKKKIVVAVIDSGIDTAHEDLKPVLWNNKKEIPGNQIDDDKNGYVDDVHGWNFIGGKDGKNVGKDSYEAARVYYKYKKLFGDSVVNETQLTTEKKEAYRLYQRAKFQLESQAKEAAMYVLVLKDIVERLPAADSILQVAMGKKTFTGDDLQQFTTSDPAATKARSNLLGLFQQTRQMESTNTALVSELVQFYSGEKSKVEALEKEPFPYRASIVQDNYTDPKDRFYGNNDIMGTDASHGTHVSGIIGAVRNNNLGINGIADHVEIMTVRAVPDGDEHDKDIANAIRYAVDNGAWIINMSFGKSFSPEKAWVDEAVRYAESKGVLLVHAAGNDAKNIDTEEQYPSINENNDTSKTFTNWINVAANGATDEELAAPFTNYGRREVSLFAPGVRIYSTVPGGNTYAEKDGTSMASPVVAGVAALMLSYYPELTGQQVKQILEASVQKIPGKKLVRPGAEDEKVGMDELCSTSGIINAYEALKRASVTKGLRK